MQDRKAKNTIREEIKSVCGLKTEAEKARVSAGLIARIEALPQFAAARTVALYCSTADEVDTLAAIDRWSLSKRVVLPVVEGGGMAFVAYDRARGLCPGAFGISRPVGEEVCLPGEIDLMVVPGVAFDRAGHRLGRGAGYYDRYLGAVAPERRPYLVGLCFPWQLVDTIPAEPHDIRMDKVVGL